ncbi:hypothetical protein DFP93_102115 [Aneurinibacillus soli]|uniref:Uncharacterized protein n=1 Tax=Aneurinibacillus soli TaxID=1500254 RepID=A0A0U5AV59_9BACL|nr:hypothetical protein [Aneurinibacillus soli]PYE63431.1 hypothetical protein DFP93_102115 [Aneurinibacillus soli]BAU27637.1 hypothetical protein CB4_01811 [Aneurinibacillus soli]
MARHLYIAGVDRWRDYERDTLQIESVLTYQIDTCSFQVRGKKPAQGEEAIIEDDSLGRLFGGTIVKVTLGKTLPDRSNRLWQVECDDYTDRVDQKLVVETYEDQPADAIFRDIVSKYCPGFTVKGIRAGAPTIESIVFNYRQPSDCFKELCDYIGWHWMVDYQQNISFFSADELVQPAPLKLVSGGRFRSMKYTIDTQGLRNRVYVRGGTMLSDFFTYEIKSDGTARTWILPHQPHELSFTVGGISVSVGIENVDKEEDYPYLVNVQEKYVKASNQVATIPAGTTISWTYKYDVDVITMVEDLESQQKLTAVQGGDGVYEHVITDDSLVTIEAAEAAGNADLRENANPKVKGSFETEVNGWQPGQLVEISLSDRGIEGTFLVQKVTIEPTIGGKLWTYRVEYGGRLLGIADFLKALVSAQQKKKVGETELLHKFSYGQDAVGITDEIQAVPRTLPYRIGDPDALIGFTEVGA